MADRALNTAGIALAVLMPLAFFLAVALFMGRSPLAVLELWGGWLVVIGVLLGITALTLRGGRR